MKIFSNLSDLNHKFTNTAVALGTFDGVHIGHQKVISSAIDLAKQSAGMSVVFTFANHPLTIINPRRCPLQISTFSEKEKLIENLGVDVLLSIPFTKEFLHLSPQDFILELAEYLQPSYLVVGPNYHFGYHGAGTPDTLRLAGEKHGFSVVIQPAVYHNNVLASSTIIRKLILDGKVDQAASLLGRNLSLRGVVITGDGRGRMLGFPTANLAVDQGLVIPGNGVYAVKVNIDSLSYNAVANIGVNPRFRSMKRESKSTCWTFQATFTARLLLLIFYIN